MKAIRLSLLALTLLKTAICGDLRARFQTGPLDVQTESSVVKSPDLPGLEQDEHVVSVSIRSTDYSASSFCVNAIVLLSDGTTGGTTKCVDKSPTDGPVTLQFSTGAVKPIAWLRLLVTRMHAEPADQLVNTFRRDN